MFYIAKALSRPACTSRLAFSAKGLDRGKCTILLSNSHPLLINAISLQSRFIFAGNKLTPWRQRGVLDAVLVNRDLTSLPENFEPTPGVKAVSRTKRKPKWLTSSLAGISNPLMTVLRDKKHHSSAAALSSIGLHLHPSLCGLKQPEYVI